MTKSPVAFIAPSTSDPTVGSAKFKTAAIASAAIYGLTQYTTLSHDNVMAIAEIAIVQIAIMGLIDAIKAWRAPLMPTPAAPPEPPK